MNPSDYALRDVIRFLSNLSTTERQNDGPTGQHLRQREIGSQYPGYGFSSFNDLSTPRRPTSMNWLEFQPEINSIYQHSQCPCAHNPSCPYRQDAERLKKLNKSWKLDVRANTIRLDVITADNEKLQKDNEKISKTIEKLMGIITETKADGERREAEYRTESEKRDAEHRKEITQLQHEISTIKSKME